MFGLRGAGVLGASVAVAGGVVYLLWNHASFSGEKEPEPRPGEDGEGRNEEERRETEAEPGAGPGAEPGAGPGPGPGAGPGPGPGPGAGPGPEPEPGPGPGPGAGPGPGPGPGPEPEPGPGPGPEPGAVVAAKAPKVSESRSVESGGTQVLVLGLDGAGKTSLLHCFATGGLDQDTQPTQGFKAVSINREDLHIEFLEIGGKEELRLYWQKYMSKALFLVFVVDSSKPQLFPVAKKHLHELLASDPRLPLMVLANKQDLPGSCSITDLHDALSLSEVGDRRLFLIGTHVKKGEAELSSGVQDAQDLIIQMVCEAR